MATDRPLIVGKLGAAHGVKGWIRVNSYTEPATNIVNYHPWLICKNGHWEELEIVDIQLQGNNVLILIKDYNDRETVRLLTGADIAIDQQQLPALAQGEYYWADLYGLTVKTTTGETLGIVDHLIETGSNDVLVIVGNKRHLVPFMLEKFVKKIDLQEKIILVDWDPNF